MKKSSLERKEVGFQLDRKRSGVGDERRSRGSEFHTVGAANEKERRPIADLMLGIVSKFLSLDLRDLEGVYAWSKSARYTGSL
jgi:hypothetical protein